MQTICAIKLYSTGRSIPIASRYRPNHKFGDYKYMGQITFDVDRIFPNDTWTVVNIHFTNSIPDEYKRTSTNWQIYEGGRLVGEGMILEIIKEKS